MDAERRKVYLSKVEEEQASLRAYEQRGTKKLLALNEQGPTPLRRLVALYATVLAFIGQRTLDPFPLKDLVDYIDWSPFFHAWEMRGRHPAILEDTVVVLGVFAGTFRRCAGHLRA